jgi:hypothetical protein
LGWHFSERSYSYFYPNPMAAGSYVPAAAAADDNVTDQDLQQVDLRWLWQQQQQIGQAGAAD